jgi:uncharacterized membrane-anchored protein
LCLKADKEAEMATKTEPVRRGIARVGQGLQEKAWTLGRDKRAERRKQFLYTGLAAALAAGATMLARRLASKAYRILTGEEPPAKK